MIISEKEAALVCCDGMEESVGELVHLVIQKLDKHASLLGACSCSQCEESSRWALSASRCLKESFMEMAYGSNPGTCTWLSRRAVLYLAAQGATAELVRRVKTVQDHHEMVRPHENEE